MMRNKAVLSNILLTLWGVVVGYGVLIGGARLSGLFAAVRRPDKPCSYSSASYARLVYDTKL